MPNTTYIALIPLLPLAGFLLLGIFGRTYFKNTSGMIGTSLLLASTLLSLYTAYGYFFDYGKVNGVYQKLVPLQITWLEFSKGVSDALCFFKEQLTCILCYHLPNFRAS